MERTEIVFGLDALRKVLLRSLVVVAATGLLSFFFSKRLTLYLIQLIQVKAYYFSLPEAFLATVELAIYVGIFVSVPIIGVIAWREFRPLLERKKIQGHLFVVSAILLFYLGSIFCLAIVLPSGVSFLLSYQGGVVKAMISIKRLILFCAAMMFAFGCAFELPLVLLLLAKLKIVTSRTLTRGRRFAVLFIVIVASVITPTPDIYNMSLLAVPLYVLYEFGVALVKMSEKRSARADAPA
jgi:sec-independent protein translocase protein TatC